MTKNNLQEKIKFVGDSVHDVVAEMFDKELDNQDVRVITEDERYGDTYLDVRSYVDDDTEVEVRENIENEISIDSVIDKLKENDYFRETIGELIQHVCWNRSF